MINDQELVSQGYREYPSHNGAEKSFSKCVRDGSTKKYFIRIEKWNFNGKLSINPIRYSYSVALFESGSTGQDFTISGSVESIQDVEQFVERVFSNMKCEPDRHNN